MTVRPAGSSRTALFVFGGGVLLALGFISSWLAWELWRENQVTALASAVVPAVPSLPTESHLLEDRLYLVTLASHHRDTAQWALAELALLYHANARPREAEQMERGLRALTPSEPRWAYLLADTRLTAGDGVEAEKLLLETLRLAPNYAPAELKVADLLFRHGREKDAAVHYARRLALLPGDAHAQLGLARIALQSADWAKAASELETLISTHPQFPTAHNFLAGLYAQLGDETRAEEHRRLGLASGRFHEAEDPWLAKLHAWSYDDFLLETLEETPLRKNQLGQSIGWYEKALRAASHDDGRAYHALAELYQSLDQLDAARTTLQAGLAASPQTEALYLSLAGVLHKQGRAAEIIELLRRGTRTLPNSAKLQNGLGAALDEAGRGDEALAAYGEAVRLYPGYADATFNRGLRLRALGRADEARASFQRVLELRPNDADTLLILAQDELSGGQRDAAETYLKTFERAHPERPDGRRLLGNWHLGQGLAAMAANRLANAEQSFRAGLAVNPDSPELHANLGTLLAQQENYTDALPHLERFLALAPQRPSAYLYLGQTYLAMSRMVEGEKILEKGLALAQKPTDPQPKASDAGLVEQFRRLLKIAKESEEDTLKRKE